MEIIEQQQSSTSVAYANAIDKILLTQFMMSDLAAERRHYAALLAGVEIRRTVGTVQPLANCDAPPDGL
jgi:hypothetical protein